MSTMLNTKTPMEPQNTMENAKSALLAAALPHVPFDGWSQTTFDAAVSDSGIKRELALALFARGGLDMALAFHGAGDRTMSDAFFRENLAGLRYRDKVALAPRHRYFSPASTCARRSPRPLGYRGCYLAGLR